MGALHLFLAASIFCLLFPFEVSAFSELPPAENSNNPSGVMVLDGSFVMNVGEVHININNTGLIGSTPGSAEPFSEVPSCQWPAGSGNEYLFSAGLWVGGVMLGGPRVSTGGPRSEWKPLSDMQYTMYEGVGGKILRPPGNLAASGRRFPESGSDDDEDGIQDEEILNGFDDDGDGEIDEDFAQIGNQMFVCTNYDNTRLSMEEFSDHQPLNLEMVQTCMQWENDQVDDFVGFDYTIKNIGVTDITNVFIGFFADSDLGPRGMGDIFNDDMAGSWRGPVRASDGSWVPVEVGYMWDNAETNPLDGYFGVLFLGHDTDPTERTAPSHVGLRTFQSFSSQASFEQGGDPQNDAQRYELLSAEPADWDANATREGDFRFLVSAGPFATLAPGSTLDFQVGMVVGPGRSGLLANCAEAALTWYGIQTDTIAAQPQISNPNNLVEIGELGRETMLCREDFDLEPGGVNPFDNIFLDFGDTSCVSPQWLLGQDRVTDDELFYYNFGPGDTRQCAMFNMDNCFECIRQLGPLCDDAALENGVWKCNQEGVEGQVGCTGVEGNETTVNWLVGMAPPPPGLRLWAADNRVHVFWDDRSQTTPDIRLHEVDFESYRVWRADNWDRPFGSSATNGPASSLWQMIAEFDIVNNFVSILESPQGTVFDTIPLGANTGMEVVSYTPRILTDPQFDGLAEAMQQVVDNDPDGSLTRRPHLRNSQGQVRQEYVGLVRWESYPAALDTFFMVAYRAPDATNSVREKHSIQFHEYIDRNIHNGFTYFYSVTATDHALLAGNESPINLPMGPGLGGDPGSSFDFTVPGTEAQSAEDRQRDGSNIYVFPNPATRDALAEYQQMHPSGNDPTGVRVTFTNLPESQSTISIFTVAGDLVQTIEHDGLGGVGHASWNLVSRNHQEINSGIYLYSVQADDSRFDDFLGKFVVVR